jgi:chemotaxis protein CheX
MSDKFKSEVQDGVNVIGLPQILSASMATDLDNEVKQWMLVPVELHVIDFGSVLNLDPAVVRSFSAFRNTLKENKKHLASINVGPQLLQMMKTSGLEAIFNPAASVAEAKKAAGLTPKIKLNAALLDPFIMATVNAMKMQVSLDVKCGKPFLKNSQLPMEIAGVISLNNSDLPGTIAICFPKAVFLALYEMMVGEKHTEITSEIQDAASEILNIIFGQAKTALLTKGIRLERAIPVVLAGQQLKLHFGNQGAGSMVLPFESKVGSFHMEVVLG